MAALGTKLFIFAKKEYKIIPIILTDIKKQELKLIVQLLFFKLRAIALFKIMPFTITNIAAIHYQLKILSMPP